MLEQTHRKCKEIRNRLSPVDEWVGVVHERMIGEAASPGNVLLELGCGREGVLVHKSCRDYRLSIGCDMEIASQSENGEPWALVRADAHHVPLRSASVDTIAMAHVMEHLADPNAVLRECARVLRPEGRLILETVNKWFPPIILGRVLPHRPRQFLNRIASGTPTEDTFPGYFRANSASSLTCAGHAAGLRLVQMQHVSHHPRYFMFSVTVYRLAVCLEQIVRRHDFLGGLRQFLIAEFQKPHESRFRHTHA